MGGAGAARLSAWHAGGPGHAAEVTGHAAVVTASSVAPAARARAQDGSLTTAWDTGRKEGVPVLVGTSGWQYRDWRGVLYPPDVPQRRWLEHYAERFATVENNNTFYRLPARETFADWRERTPGGFVMAVKASRYLTHIKRLRDPAEPVGRLLGAAAGLGDRLGPVLLQLPPNLAADPQLLDACLGEFGQAQSGPGQSGPGQSGPGQSGPGQSRPGQSRPGQSRPGQSRPGQSRPGQSGPGQGPRTPVRVAVEPRHQSWWTDEVRQVLTAHHAALAWTDRLGHPLTPLWNTAGWAYLRFHEGAASPWPRYGERALTSWVKRITQTWPEDADVHVYFNNDQGGAAGHDAAAFAALARHAGLKVAHTVAHPDAPAH